ncbi:phospholipid scramblase-related protein [Actinomadura flavalba]|uniref:phospholipid scramblase-related protein n=1 Tax=Actinomadura flavalba TaxID=1120938 RepID=UPI00036D6C03|nr:phospholipid scramblase-related protein [Actinomadura flavalba]
MSELFTSPVLRVEQPRRGPSARVRYKVSDGDGTLLATAEENSAQSRAQTLKSVFPGKSNLDARGVVISDAGGEPLLVIDKPEGRTLIRVCRPDGTTVGTYNTLHAGRTFALRDGDDAKIGGLVGDLSRRNFTIADADGKQVAVIRKRFSGVLTHLLTTSDKYDVEISADVPEPLRTLAVAGAIAMDLALHESKEII